MSSVPIMFVKMIRTYLFYFLLGSLSAVATSIRSSSSSSQITGSKFYLLSLFKTVSLTKLKTIHFRHTKITKKLYNKNVELIRSAQRFAQPNLILYYDLEKVSRQLFYDSDKSEADM